MTYGSRVVRSKSSVVIGYTPGDGRLDGGVCELLIGQRQSRVDKRCQLVLMVNEEDLQCTRTSMSAMYMHV